MKDFKRDTTGSITIFLTLILVPCVVFISLFIDLARFEYISYKLQASSDLALNAGLTNYNSTLKEMYGLFGVSEVEETEELISEYFLSNLNVNYGLEASDNFDFYQIKLLEADSQSIGSVVNNTNLRNPDVLKHQIVEYMKYLGPYEIGTEIFDQIERLEKLVVDTKALKEKNEIDESLEKVDEQYLKLSELVEKSDSFKGYDEYDKLVNYYISLNKANEKKEALEEEIEALEEEIEKLKSEKIETDTSTTQKNEEGSKVEENDKQSFEVEDKKKTLEQKSKELESIEKEIKSLKQNIKKTFKSCMELFSDQIENQEKIIKITKDIEKNLDKAEKSIDKLENKYLNSTSTSVNTALKEEIKEYDKIIGTTEGYNATKLKQLAEENRVLLQDDQTAIETSNKLLSEAIDKLGYLREDKLRKEYILSDLKENYILYAQHKDTKKFVQILEEYKKNSDESKATLDEIKKKLEVFKDKFVQEMEINDVKIPDAIYDGFSEDKSDDDEQELSGGEAFDSISDWVIDTVEGMRDKLLVIEYAKGMFSNYRSNRNGDNQINSYSNTPINNINNFLYQSELEYILNGKDSSKKNIDGTENMINLMRFGFNYIYTFTDKNINIQLNALAAPITASLSPLAGMVFKETLRLIVAELESIIDVNYLQRGEEVPLMKTEKYWNLKLDEVVDEFGDKKVLEDNNVLDLNNDLQDSYSDDGNPFTLDYEDYINLFLLLINENKLCDRIGDLIELNMTSNKNNGVVGESLSYELNNTYTYFQIDSELEADFVFMRLPFVNLFLDEGIKFEKRSMKYKDIKGY